ncbi:PREDICTED: ovalbumin-related protein X-like [Dufourea novaeangliae]|uniref:ovalbumin-related protein X-like n=1 Tax=Dufourea novaeangliae TaxID=178035 RepID=UPI000766F019|nr:PREDICTED: ovalbumin-related protein X-like [Dufourea novaeangliae]
MTMESTNIYKNLSSSCTDFTKAFNKELCFSNEGNIVSSPLSIHMILSLLSHGAETETLNELTSGLCHHEKSSIKEGYTNLTALLNELSNVKLYIANAIYVQDGFELLTEFSTIGTNAYKSVVSKLDFKHKTEAATRINTWVEETTNHTISDLVSADDFDEHMKLVLINAIYYNGMWLHKFDKKQTQKKAFHVTRNEKRMVATMFNKSKYDYGEIPTLDAKFIEIPYMNKDIVMTVLLPNEVDGLKTLQNNFSLDILENASRTNAEIELYLPKFKIEFMVDLKKILRKLGLNTMFQDNADFGRISNVPLKVSKVLHKAMIEVNEEGTEAAAATVVHMRLRRMIYMPEQFLVDRPFMFIIQHKPSNVPLFVGCVKDIKSVSEKDEL